MESSIARPVLPTEKFDAIVIAEPVGDWEYDLDDHGVHYDQSTWPFCYQRGEHREPTSVRLAPNTEYQTWRTQYVIVFPVPGLGTESPEPVNALVAMQVLIRSEGAGGWVQSVFARIQLNTWAYEWYTPPLESIAAQAQAKLTKVLRFLQRACEERDRGVKRPATAHERWSNAQAENRSSAAPPG